MSKEDRHSIRSIIFYSSRSTCGPIKTWNGHRFRLKWRSCTRWRYSSRYHVFSHLSYDWGARNTTDTRHCRRNYCFQLAVFITHECSMDVLIKVFSVVFPSIFITTFIIWTLDLFLKSGALSQSSLVSFAQVWANKDRLLRLYRWRKSCITTKSFFFQNNAELDRMDTITPTWWNSLRKHFCVSIDYELIRARDTSMRTFVIIES